MLDAKDVRIGNWVIKITGTDRNTKSFFEYQPIALGENAFSFASVCFPIKLNAAMLGSCGFRNESGEWYKNLEVEGLEDGLPLLRYKTENGSWYLKGHLLDLQPEYVHQLQNLYYALTGKELETELGFFQNIDIFGPIAYDIKPDANTGPAYLLL